MKFLFLEPFFGGSHKEFALGIQEHSRHEIELLTLPARFWKWRMGGSALWFCRRLESLAGVDGIIASDMLNLCDFLALAHQPVPPVLFYFHENQFAYPLGPGEEKHDLNYGLINAKSALAATRVAFNSRFHRDVFLKEVAGFSTLMPDARVNWMRRAIHEKSRVLYPGCRFGDPPPKGRAPGTPPLIIWNHRWEHDKNPEAFFNVLDIQKNKGRRFRLALLGERYTAAPKVFDDALERFRDEIVVSGFMPSRKEYLAWLGKGDLVISTAVQENFGMAVIEAVRMGCFPLLPARLSYPEIMPDEHHDAVLYRDDHDLAQRLGRMLDEPEAWVGNYKSLAGKMERFSWHTAVKEFDDELEGMVHGL